MNKCCYLTEKFWDITSQMNNQISLLATQSYLLLPGRSNGSRRLSFVPEPRRVPLWSDLEREFALRHSEYCTTPAGWNRITLLAKHLYHQNYVRDFKNGIVNEVPVISGTVIRWRSFLTVVAKSKPRKNTQTDLNLWFQHMKLKIFFPTTLWKFFEILFSRFDRQMYI